MSHFDEKRLNPSSYNLTLANELLVYDSDILDMKKPNPASKIIIPEEGLILQPNKLYLGRINEYTHTDRFVPQHNNYRPGFCFRPVFLCA